jgi:hypothetical protein
MHEQTPPNDTFVIPESDGALEQPVVDTPVEGDERLQRASRPFENVKGIHPELLCQCPECEPEHVELQWFSPEEVRKQKGDAMLYCQRSSRKYFTPILDLNRWLASRAPVSRRRTRD